MPKNIDEQIEELETQIETAEKEPEKKEEVEQEEKPEDQAVSEGEKEDAEPEFKEPVKEEPKPEVKTAPSPAEAWAIREAKRLAKENDDLKTQINQPKPEPKNEDVAPDPETDPVAYLAWENRQLRKDLEPLKSFKDQQETAQRNQQAEVQRIQGFQSDAALAESAIPDLGAGIDHMFETLKGAMKVTHPTAPPHAIEAYVKNQMFTWADQYAQQGMNRAQALYLLSKQNYGYTMKEPEPQVIKDPKASLATIEKNRAKSASGLGTGTSKSNPITAEAFSKMSIAQMEENRPELEAAGYL